jgi:glyoxylase-like metal-dependent hydrolase (beta-lactamase superfamily II)
MRLSAVNAGHFKLDGGAMFGVVPKSMWSKLNPADDNNMCSWAMRCLLVEEGNRLILIDNGMGDKQDAKFFSHYYLHGEDNLEKSIHKAGYSLDQITDVFLTHLHFDHCGGSIQYTDSSRSKLETTFKNAAYWTNEDHWNWAIHPNSREKASFLKENIFPIQESGQIQFLEKGQFLSRGFETIFVDGHTEAMMLPLIHYKGKKILFCADLLPSAGHLPIPYVMSYDVRPLQTLVEKTNLLNQALEEEWILFFEHDPLIECAMLERTEKGIGLIF